MHLAVNTRFLLPGGQLEGIGRYTYELLRCLVAQHPDVTFHFLFDRAYDPRYVLGPNVVAHVLGPPARHPLLYVAWFEGAVAGWLRRHRPAAFLSPDGFTTLRTQVPRALVLHDLAYVHRPLDMGASYRYHYRYFVPRYARAAAGGLVTVSDATRQDVAHQFGLDPNRIRVAYNAPAAHFQPQTAAQQVATRARFAQGRPYFLFVGALQPRKNLANLLRAFGRFRTADGPAAAEVQLLLVGRTAWQAGPIFDAYQNLTAETQAAVHFAGRVGETELAALYAAALATAYVPFFEGFGLPVVEAQASGCPVLTSNVSSLPEVAGPGGAVFVDPADPADIAAGLNRLWQEPALRTELAAAGRRNVARFSWDRSAEVVWEAIQGAIGGTPPLLRRASAPWS